MRKDLINRYIWIIDTIQRYGKITRKELNDLWLSSAEGDGRSIPARTFFHYRRAIEENFKIDIECNSLGEYYIETHGSVQDERIRNWLLDSYTIRGVMENSAELADRILLEDVPSAREYMPTLVKAMRVNKKVTFTYYNYMRSMPEREIVFSPYFIKLFKQRWYMIGAKDGEKGRIRTYALDRVSDMFIVNEHFKVPDHIDPATFYDDYFGITTTEGDVRRISLMATPRQAKFLRALPLHQSQIEEVHDDYSIFSYKMKLTGDLVRELMSCGDGIKVISPSELRVMLIDEYKKALSAYESADS